MDNVDKYLNEGDTQEVLFKRYLKVLDKAGKIYNSMGIQSTELGRIQKKMKKNGIDALYNKMDHPVFTVDEDTSDRIRSMVLEQ